MWQHLAAPWEGKPDCTVLELGFGSGQQFVALYRLLRQCTAPPRMLHYVALSEAQPDLTMLVQQPEMPADSQPSTWGPLYPGFNRVLLDGGRVSLTLCIGPMARMLTELRMQADAVCMHRTPGIGDAAKTKLWTLIARNCRQGAQLVLQDAMPDRQTLEHLGFTELATPRPSLAQPASAQVYCLRFAPRWQPKQSRRLISLPQSPGCCAVVGAGLSGAAVARALALRGWQVSVYDSCTHPAGGASGVPAGLCVPTRSQDNNPQSRLTQQGTRLSLAHAQRLLRMGWDWQASGVLQRVWGSDGSADYLHAHAGWLKPASLVQAWLQHANIRWVGGQTVEHLRRCGTRWVLEAAGAHEIGHADVVVLANAAACTALARTAGTQVSLAEGLLPKLEGMQVLYGALSYGRDLSGFAARPVNGSGTWIGNVPTAAGAHWYAGAGYDTAQPRVQDAALHHAANAARLQMLWPEVGQAMAQARADSSLGLWQGARCTTEDRMPLVGPVDAGPQPSVWMCAGMGSRGISLGALCAELLAAYLHAEPLPLESSLSKSLFSLRPAKGRAQKTD